MAKYVKVDDVVELIDGLEGIPWGDETKDLVNSLQVYDTDKVADNLEKYGEANGVLVVNSNGQGYYISVGKAVEMLKGGVD